jgi:hypothetical protein
MIGISYNPFGGIDISVPAAYKDDMDRYCMGRAGNRPDMAPFPRKIDMWFMAACVAVSKNLEPVATSSVSQTTKIIDGNIFSSDPWRIVAMQLIAINHTGSEDAIMNPREVISLLNGFAWAGMPSVIEMLKEDEKPIWSLSESLDSCFSDLKSK